MPRSGALDLVSLAAANRAAGNWPSTPALEVLGGRLFLEALANFEVGISGAPTMVRVDGLQTYGEKVYVPAGHRLLVEPATEFTIFYAAFKSGVYSDVVLGSASTYTRGCFGGHEGRAIKSGDMLFRCNPPAQPSKVEVGPAAHAPDSHRAVRGLHADLFPPEAYRAFFSSEFTISPESDRMGYRLEGAKLQTFHGAGTVTTVPVIPGMVQVPPDGTPIVLMADSNTTGGYPVIALVPQPDLSALARKFPTGKVRFREISNDEALKAQASQCPPGSS